jgi:hypothetical protein
LEIKAVILFRFMDCVGSTIKFVDMISDMYTFSLFRMKLETHIELPLQGIFMQPMYRECQVLQFPITLHYTIKTDLAKGQLISFAITFTPTQRLLNSRLFLYNINHLKKYDII